MAHFTAIAGSIGPLLDDVLTQGGAAYDLTAATGVVLRLRHAATDEIVDFVMTIDGDPTTGRVFRVWAAGDLDLTPGVWWGQYRVTSAGGVEIWPTEAGGSCNHPLGWHGLEFQICPANPAP